MGRGKGLVVFQPPAGKKTKGPRKSRSGPRGAIIAAGQGFFGDRDVLRIQNDLVGGRGNTDGHGRPAAAQDTESLLGKPTESPTNAGIIRTTAPERVQSFSALVPSRRVERWRGS